MWLLENLKWHYGAHLTFILASTTLDTLHYIYKFNEFDFLINASNTSKKYNLPNDLKERL